MEGVFMQNNNNEYANYDDCKNLIDNFKGGFGNLGLNEFLYNLAIHASIKSLGDDLDDLHGRELKDAVIGWIKAAGHATPMESIEKSNSKVAVFLAISKNFNIGFTMKDLKSLLQEEEYLLDKYPINEMLNDDKIKNLIREGELQNIRPIELVNKAKNSQSKTTELKKDAPRDI